MIVWRIPKNLSYINSDYSELELLLFSKMLKISRIYIYKVVNTNLWRKIILYINSLSPSVCLSFTYLLFLLIHGPFFFGTFFLLLFHNFSFFLYTTSFSLFLWRHFVFITSQRGSTQAGKDWARGSSTGALCTGFTLVLINHQIVCWSCQGITIRVG